MQEPKRKLMKSPYGDPQSNITPVTTVNMRKYRFRHRFKTQSKYPKFFSAHLKSKGTVETCVPMLYPFNPQISSEHSYLKSHFNREVESSFFSPWWSLQETLEQKRDHTQQENKFYRFAEFLVIQTSYEFQEIFNSIIIYQKLQIYLLQSNEGKIQH